MSGGGPPGAATQRRLGVLKRQVVALSSHPASLAQPVEEALRRLPGGDGPGDPGIPTAADPKAMMSVFILAGQSSMAGRGMLPEFQTLNPDILGASSSGLLLASRAAFALLQTHELRDYHRARLCCSCVLAAVHLLPPLAELSVPTACMHCLAAFDYLDDSWDVAREPLHIDPPIRDAGIKGKSSYPMGTGLGLGYSFARELLASGGVDGPIGLVPCAYGGSPLSRWERQPGLADEWVGNAINIVGNGDVAVDGDLYARMIRRTRLALERPNCVLRGVLWHQGESDTRDLSLAQSYAARLKTLVNNIREDLAAPYLFWPTVLFWTLVNVHGRSEKIKSCSMSRYLPFLIGELGHWLLAEPSPDGKGGMHGAHTVRTSSYDFCYLLVLQLPVATVDRTECCGCYCCFQHHAIVTEQAKEVARTTSDCAMVSFVRFV